MKKEKDELEARSTISLTRSVTFDTTILQPGGKSTRQLIRLPGFIDTHVHTRDPGETHKEDFDSCTAAALAGGITLICAMPNTLPPVIDEASFNLVNDIARQRARCDYAFYVGAYSENTETVCELSTEAIALKMYLSDAYTTFKMDSMEQWYKHIENWPKTAPVCVHADTEGIAAIIMIARFHNKPIHICHVTTKEEIDIIKAAKIRGHKVTCEACAPNLFLAKEDLKKLRIPEGDAKPSLGTAEDRKALWNNLEYIDCFSSDHAPHTVEERDSGGIFQGFPGLETTLPLLLNAVSEGKLTMEDLIDKFYNNPRQIFNLPDQPDTFVEIDPEKEWTIPEKLPYTKCKWTPYAGTRIKGFIRRVFLRGKLVYENGNVTAPPGFGQNVKDLELESISQSKASSGEIKPLILSGLNVHGLEGKNILGVEIFTKESMSYLYDLSRSFKASILKDVPIDHILRGKILASVFYEVSTRARCSFDTAMQRLGGGVIYLNDITSSSKKGETIEDAITVMGKYADVIVIRHPVVGTPHRVTKQCNKPIINLGDGTGEHPTQALLTAVTIREELGTINGLTIAMVGDLKNARTVHSLAKLMTIFNVSLLYVSPRNLRMPSEVFSFVSDRGIPQRETTSLEAILPDADVLYMTRVQRERFTNPEEYDQSVGLYIITPQLMAKAKKRMIVLHALPRVYEIRRDFDSDPRAAYFRQAENGLYVTMALLTMVLGVC